MMDPFSFTQFLSRYNRRFPSQSINAKPSHKNWMKIGTPGYPPGAGYHLSFTNDGRCRVEITFQSSDQQLNKFMYDVLLRYREEIEQQLGAGLEWERKDQVKRSQISMYYPGSLTAIGAETPQDRYLEWVVPAAERFQMVINEFLLAYGQISRRN